MLKLGDRGPRVEALQKSLVAFGRHVLTDGKYGTETLAAVAASQVLLGLPGDGIASPEFVTKLEATPSIAKGEREVASKKEVKEVSFAARAGDNLRTAGGVGL